jgi:hypothetical protein
MELRLAHEGEPRSVMKHGRRPLGLLLVFAVGCGNGGNTSNSNDAAAGSSSGSSSGSSDGFAGSSSGTSGGSSGAGDAGTCSADAQCRTGNLCGFLESDGCSAAGACFPVPSVTCKSVVLACACDGTDINVACNGLPNGYAPKPLARSGACGLDSGAGGHAFACGTATCNSAAQYCSIVIYGHAILPDGGQGSSQTTTCGAFDGGASCPGGSGAMSAGACGCYESPTGEVTITECTP